MQFVQKGKKIKLGQPLSHREGSPKDTPWGVNVPSPPIPVALPPTVPLSHCCPSLGGSGPQPGGLGGAGGPWWQVVQGLPPFL